MSESGDWACHRRAVVLGLSAVFLTPRPAGAQPAGRTFRAGFLSSFPLPPDGRTPLLDVFEDGLRDKGFVPRSNLSITYRSPLGWYQEESLRELAAQLVGLRPDVIIALQNPAISAVSRVAAAIPVVMVGALDPVGNGFVSSLSRPATNMTGLTWDIGFRRQLEVLKEVIPRLSRVAVLRDSRMGVEASYVTDAETAAARQGVTLVSLELHSSADLAPAFRTLARAQPDALVLWDSPLFHFHGHLLMDLVRASGLPLLASSREYAELGALASYGIDRHSLFREAATYVGKILNGAKPGDLPVERPRKFEFVVNLGAARRLGLAMPSTLVLWADHVVE